MPALLGLALAMVLLGSGQARADLVDPPEGAKVEFTTTSPGVTSTSIQPTGTYIYPQGWSVSKVEVNVYAVKAGGAQGDLIKTVAADTKDGFWDGLVTGLSPDTEYWVEGKMTLKKGLLGLDHAYKSTDPLIKAKTKAKKGFNDDDEGGGDPPPP
ncbi:hypothetical protein [Urbifossiella limnaea]|uniref:Uncharacterized protein n=1 Tax=Urbifossiella limnaea TaxID=2528023 RepID=A0A517XZR8_9BACT|nr:hypothetical protein [Urbifossiella limnaea]QDU23000.1 hypothetical protein ETAA1_49900 [Urbifossiella limnaea]